MTIKSLIVALSLVLALSFTACGNKDNNNQSTTDNVQQDMQNTADDMKDAANDTMDGMKDAVDDMTGGKDTNNNNK